MRDRDLDLTYMQARYYDPTIGRFMGVDPVGFLDNGKPEHFNRYAYAYNNPYKYTDPDGENPIGGSFGLDISAFGFVAQLTLSGAVDFVNGDVGGWGSLELGGEIPDRPQVFGFANVLVGDEDLKMAEVVKGDALTLNGSINLPGRYGLNIVRSITKDRLKEENVFGTGMTEVGVSYGVGGGNPVNIGMTGQQSSGWSFNLGEAWDSFTDSVSDFFSGGDQDD